MKMMTSRLTALWTGRALALTLVALVLLAGCASAGGRSDNVKRAERYARAGEWDNAIT